MTIETLRNTFLYCGIINFGLLLFWAMLMMVARSLLQRRAGWFGIPPEKSDSIHYTGMMLLKLGIVMFNFVPYIALRIVA